MKLVSFIATGSAQPRVGALLTDGRTIADLARGAELIGRPTAAFDSMLALLDAGTAGMEAARAVTNHAERERPAAAVHAAESVRLLAPLPRPRSIRDCMSFERHVIGCMRAVARHRYPLIAAADRWSQRLTGRGLLKPPKAWYERPLYYKGNPHSIVGTEAEIRWPSHSRKLDYELEFGILIGRAGRDIPAERAKEHIAGFLIFNDFSARDIQGQEMVGRLGPAKGKDFDTGNAMGPWLVTPDEIPDPYQLAMTARINGVIWSQGHSRDMRWRFEQLIEYISRDETLYPGEFIGGGACAGGCGLELDRWLKPGDVVELEVERLGILRNRIVRP